MNMIGNTMASFAGLEIRVSPVPLQRQVPVRKHKYRRNQSLKYHRRVQKKWTKRWGTKTERYALMMNPRAVGLLGGPMALLDPRDMVLLRGL